MASMSSGIVTDAPRFSGRASALLSRWRVLIPPGNTIVTPMPSSASSRRNVSAKPVIANLLVVYAPSRTRGHEHPRGRGDRDMAPAAAPAHPGQEARHRAHGAEHVHADHPGPVVLGEPVDASELLHADVGARGDRNRRTARRREPPRRAPRPASPTSTRIAAVGTPRRSSSEAVACALDSSMSSAATAMPASAHCRAIAAPRPEPAPVTTATRPANSRGSVEPLIRLARRRV